MGDRRDEERGSSCAGWGKRRNRFLNNMCIDTFQFRMLLHQSNHIAPPELAIGEILVDRPDQPEIVSSIQRPAISAVVAISAQGDHVKQISPFIKDWRNVLAL